MKRKVYEAEPCKRQVKLCRLQESVKQKDLCVIIAFEGRGTIRTIAERISPRPSEREEGTLKALSAFAIGGL